MDHLVLVMIVKKSKLAWCRWWILFFILKLLSHEYFKKNTDFVTSITKNKHATFNLFFQLFLNSLINPTNMTRRPKYVSMLG